MDNEELGDEGTTFLKDPLSLPKLVEQGTTFEINSDFNNVPVADDDFLDLNDESDENINSDEDFEKIVSPWMHPFDELKAKMIQINEYIYKKIVREGNAGKGLVPLNARVKVRYNAYFEKEGAPFDSSYLRGSSYNFYTGQNSVLEGYEQAVLSMNQGEQAQFVIGYPLLFGDLGCPPRIKPKADALFVVEVMDFNLVGDADADINLTSEEKRKFKIVIDKVKQIHLKGLDFFGQQMYRHACATFQKASNLLSTCYIENDEEEANQTEFLIRLLTNLAICYLKLNQPGKTCIMIKELRQLTSGKLSCKALFQEGKALNILGDYNRAKAVLLKCLSMEPNNKEIAAELVTLNKRFGDYKKKEKELWMKAMNVPLKEKPLPNEKLLVDSAGADAAEDTMRNLLEEFKRNCSINEIKLPDNLTDIEVEAIEELTKSMDLKLKICPSMSYTAYSVIKPQQK